MVISKSSWHYRLLKYFLPFRYPEITSSCDYVSSLLFVFLMTSTVTLSLLLVGASLVVFPIMAIVHVSGVYAFTNPEVLKLILVGVTLLWMYSVVLIIGLCVFICKFFKRLKKKAQKGDSPFKYWYKSVVEKTCSTITYID